MPRVKFDVGDYSGTEAAEGFSDYDGPTPPKGVYTFVLKWMKQGESSGGNPMLTVGAEIQEPKGTPKAQYNGAFTMDYWTLSEKTAPFTNAKLDALGLSRKAVWVDGVVCSRDNDEQVVKIGDTKVVGLLFKASTKLETYNDVERLKIASFLGLAGAESAADPDDDDMVDDDGLRPTGPRGNHAGDDEDDSEEDFD